MISSKASNTSIAKAAAYTSLYVAALYLMVSSFIGNRIPVYGYGWMPQFGANFEERMPSDFREKARYLVTSPWGYDGQFYAQLSTDPLILNPETKDAFDNFQFRARRPLFPAIAYVFGRGNPESILQVYCLLNLVFWMLIGVALLRWLPPTSWQNAIRYLFILFSMGLISSVTRSLLDGPALLLVILGVLFAEQKRPWLSATVLGFAGLGKETSVFAASAFDAPSLKAPKELLKTAARLAIVAAPLAAWMLYLSHLDKGSASSALGNSRNFSFPMEGWWTEFQVFLSRVSNGQPIKYTLYTAAFLIAMPVKAIGLVAVRKYRDAWWRVGTAYAAFSLILGFATWEGIVGSVTRVCLPLTVAFNLVIPRSAKWLPVLLLGNLLAFVGFVELRSWGPPGQYRHQPEIGAITLDGSVEWQSGWHGPEADSAGHDWRWASGATTCQIKNPRPYDAFVALTFRSRGINPGRVSVSLNGNNLGAFKAGLKFGDPIVFKLKLKPGQNALVFDPEQPAGHAPSDSRALAFVLLNPTLKEE